MRVLHILEATYGGTRRHVLDLLPALQARGIANTLIYSPWRNPEFAHDAAALDRTGVNTCAVPMTRGWGGARDLYSLRLLHQHLKSNHYDVIHCHSTKAGLLGRLVALRDARNTPIVYTPHCPAFATGLPVRQRQAARLMEKLLAPLTSH
jgi:glycosyltransferase involved in cell wall biosynthesis